MWYTTVGTITIVFAVREVRNHLAPAHLRFQDGTFDQPNALPCPVCRKSSLVLKSILIFHLRQWCIAYGILGWVPTIPVQAYWNLTLPATRYAFGSLEVEAFVATYTSLTATNMILDMIILAIPAPLLLYNKTSNAKSRWALICLFSIGSL